MAPRTVQSVTLELRIKHPLFIVFEVAKVSLRTVSPIRDEELAESRPIADASQWFALNPVPSPALARLRVRFQYVPRFLWPIASLFAFGLGFGTEADCGLRPRSCGSLKHIGTN